MNANRKFLVFEPRLNLFKNLKKSDFFHFTRWKGNSDDSAESADGKSDDSPEMLIKRV
jgi:hypothetical protein